MTTQQMGRWSQFAELNEEDQRVFKLGIQGIIGVHYTPLEVSHRSISGEHFAFFCNATTTSFPENTFPAMVTMFRAVGGKITRSEIRRIEY
ncbi:hypothetical protein F9817_10765 [Vibrio sp. CAIM 722]|uniref:Uncharacterized protein n=1 Tax=Vibrio eleionomae TaxID=2653505 RepID=A0A7X4LKM8_9VIBR|nr:hypothetical protein [Vibrio eleionomae]MZI93677.1 hypothetical protein [Vibrio eleionomae]